MSYAVEYTDTFGGQANYSWVERHTIHPRGDSEIMRLAKASVGLTGVRGTTERYGDTYEFRPYRMCRVLFVTWQEDDEA